MPAETQAAMAAAERKYSDRDPREIKRTRFEIHKTDAGDYEFVVVEQDPQRPPSVGASARRLLNGVAED
jgi:hypothetical protein